MLYDFELQRPSYYYNNYSRPRYYTTYTPTTYQSSYYSSSYTPWYRYPSSFTASVRRPYRYNFDFRYDIPDYRYRSYTTTIPKVFPSVYTTRAVSVPRFVRASSLESDSDFFDTIFRARRAISRSRMMSEEPTFYSSIKSY